LGRIKTTFVKHIARELFEKHSNQFSTDFENNKKVVDRFVDINSKRTRNIVAGYLTSLKKNEGVE